MKFTMNESALRKYVLLALMVAVPTFALAQHKQTRRRPMRVRLRLMQALRRILLDRVIQRRRNIRQPPATPARKDIRQRAVIRRPWGMRIPAPATAPRPRDIAPRPPDMERPRPGMVQRRPATAPPLRDTERRRPGMATTAAGHGATAGHGAAAGGHGTAAAGHGNAAGGHANVSHTRSGQASFAEGRRIGTHPSQWTDPFCQPERHAH